MGGIVISLLLAIWAAFVGFSVGEENQASETINQCSSSGQVTIVNTVIKCTPVAEIVRGKEVPLE